MNRRDLLRTAAAAAAAAVAVSLPLPAVADDLEMASVTRTVQVFQDGQWAVTPWEGLKRGMVFRLREGDGTLVDAGTPNEVSVALEDACIVQTGPGQKNWSVKCEPFTNVLKDHPLAARVLVFNRGELVGNIQSIHMGCGMRRAWQAPDDVCLFEHTVEFDNILVDFGDGWERFRDLTIPA